MRSGSLVVAAVLSLFVAACQVAEPLEDVRVGVVMEVDGVPSVTLPTTVRAGESFEVTVVTVGGPCIRAGETEVEIDDAVALVTPYDRYAIPRPGVGCLLVDEELWHTAMVVFDEAGPARVVVVSRAEDSDDLRELEFPVTVTD